MLLFFAVIICLVMLAVFVQIGSGYGQLDSLDAIEPGDKKDQPLVSIVIPACNEAQSIEQSLRSLCHLDYSNVEIIVVDDRSIDRTAEVVESVRHDYPAIRLIRICELPEGWLGKPHALQQGAREAEGDYLLFIDADVSLEKTTISRAVSAMEERQLDHLTLIFKNSSPGLLLNALIADIGAGLFFMIKPWKAKIADSRYFMGVGAFNMVRTSVYQSIGEHQEIKLQIVDDVYLGKLVKQNGFRQECMLAESLVSLSWYGSVSEMISGLMKNVYAFFRYRPSYVVLGVLAILVMTVAPMAGAVFAHGSAKLFFILTVLIRVAGTGGGMIRIGLSPVSIIFLLITPFIALFIILKAFFQVHLAGGVTWRGSFYALDKLRGADWVLSGLFWPLIREK
jgi:glycosyltransferase involved in cell wall biosynthesis